MSLNLLARRLSHDQFNECSTRTGAVAFVSQEVYAEG